MRHTLRAHFCSSMTLDVAICLHISQIEVCLLCARAVLGTTIGIVVYCILKTFILTRHDSQHVVCLHSPQIEIYLLCAKTLGSFSMTLGIVIRLHRPQTKVCMLCAEVPSWL